MGGNFKNLVWDISKDSSIWFYSGAFMIILGSYIVEPFFTKPSDVIANSTAVLIALFGLTTKHNLIGYTYIFYYAVTMLCSSVVTIVLKDSKKGILQKFAKALYWFVNTFGSSKVIFSIIYLAAAYSYFSDHDKLNIFISIITFWVCLTFFDVIGIAVSKISRLIHFLQNKGSDELGKAIGCENPLLYRVEIDYTKQKFTEVSYGNLVAIETSLNSYSIGMIVEIKYLLNKRWLSIYLIQDSNGDVVKMNFKTMMLSTDAKSIFSTENNVYLLSPADLENQEIKSCVQNNFLYKNREQFIGYVTSGSNINTLNFSIMRNGINTNKSISEGVILKTTIYNQETLYQVINGNAHEEHLENFDKHGFIVGIARKLGKYDFTSKELDISKWMPNIFSPLFFAFEGDVAETKIKEMSKTSIGHLPDTDMEIPIRDIDAIVTHNTAILGILGIGKSCLAYELIKKISESGVKVVCIDITNEYKKELPTYISGSGTIVSDNGATFSEINPKFEYVHTVGEKQYPEKSGNLSEYRKALHKDLYQFIFGNDEVPDTPIFEGTQKIRIYNVDYHKASRGEKIGYNVITTELTQAEKTRIIAEEVFRILMKIPLSAEKNAKVLLVFEEAHSLVPEWNSVSSDGDKNATNGTAKVVLQGRKYGLGSLVITQRTANVSKSILNQCNTIFALRVFDDTGKEFLENYIGKDYADTLATLEERHAIAIGKGLRLKQPVIIQLNNKNDVV